MNRFFILVLAALTALGTLAADDGAPEIPRNLRNNQYFTESLRLANLARLSYDAGDYDVSTSYAEESIRYARLSDEYIALQLKIRETNNAIAAAKNRLDWAVSSGASTEFPREYAEAQGHYNDARAFRSAEEWDNAIDSANKVILLLANVRGPAPAQAAPPSAPAPGIPVLPAQYTVRSWNVYRDCFWNIAGRPWVYGDSRKWKILYDANRARLPQQGNPDLILPGMVLDIPSVQGETRQGMWNEKTKYPALR
jgi:hypothetical protein